MKIKKFAIVLFSSVLMLAIAPSAFAKSGFGDDLSTAQPIELGYSYQSTVDSSTDPELTTYKNLTGKTIVVRPTVTSPASLNYDLFYIHYRNNGEIPLLSAKDNGVGGTDFIEVTLLPGETIYFNVYGHKANQYSTTEEYLFKLNYSE